MTHPASRPTKPLLAVLLTAGLGLVAALAACSTSAPLAPDPAAVTTPQPATQDAAARVQAGLLPAFVTAQTQPMQMADRMRHYGVPGISVAVVQNGQLLWAHAWGVADVATGRALTPTTVMQAASISKAVAAVGALQLVQDQRLALDASVNSQLRSWQLPPGAQSAAHAVTLRQLLSHSAGLGVSGFDGYATGAAVPTLLQVLDGLPPANSAPVRLESQPGSQWAYSGGGFVVLQQLMQDVTGESFAPWMQREVLARAGMVRSSFVAPTGSAWDAAAVGHEAGLPITGLRVVHPELAAAGLWTTPSDLARFTLALQRSMGSAASTSPTLLQAAALAQALQPQAGPTGLGFVLEGPRPAPRGGAAAPDGDPGQRFGHNGSNQGFESRWVADGQRGVAVMANSNGAMPLMLEVIRAVAQVHGWQDWQALTQARLNTTLEATPLFVRGGMNGWGLATPLQRTAPLRYSADVVLAAGRVEFKVAAADWAVVDLGRSPLDEPKSAPGAAQPALQLSPAGPNLVLNVDRPGRYRFDLDASAPAGPQLRVQRLD
jgi:CubicO group peptidase (beta-lactamase class C family)